MTGNHKGRLECFAYNVYENSYCSVQHISQHVAVTDIVFSKKQKVPTIPFSLQFECGGDDEEVVLVEVEVDVEVEEGHSQFSLPLFLLPPMKTYLSGGGDELPRWKAAAILGA